MWCCLHVSIMTLHPLHGLLCVNAMHLIDPHVHGVSSSTAGSSGHVSSIHLTDSHVQGASSSTEASIVWAPYAMIHMFMPLGVLGPPEEALYSGFRLSTSVLCSVEK